ncbi:MAG: pseudouridine synthase, partial [Actinomycetota bacterium]|nr:pseudouridine synthase [Actinomycetota bacterium]
MTQGSSKDKGGDDRGVRIQIIIARAGLASRRAAEDLLKAGRVSLNGRIISELGVRAMSGDIVAVDGKPVIAEARLQYLALNKPPGYLCAMSDDYGRPLAASLFKPEISERVYNVGRLDLDSCGLIMFTNDGAFAAKAGHPSSGLVKEYEVLADRRVPNDFSQKFEAGIQDDGETLRAERVTITGERTCTIQLVEGKNREIRRALAIFGLKADVLRRIAVGPIRLGSLT